MLFVACTIEATAKIKLYATGGIGMAYTRATNTDVAYTPILTPHLSSIMSVPLSGKITLETGGLYAIKGFNNRIIHFSDNEKVILNSKSRFHYISIPIVINYNFYKSNNAKIWLGAGMSYGFFIGGTEKAKVSKYENGHLMSSLEQTKPVTGTLSNSTFLKDQGGKRVQLLDVMFRAQMNYVWKDKYIVGIFHDHSLQDIDAKMFSDANSNLKLRYTGIALGFILY